MCRSFPSQLIEAIISGLPPSLGEVESVARHIRDDYVGAGEDRAMRGADLTDFSGKLARFAMTGAPALNGIYATTLAGRCYHCMAMPVD